MTLHVTCSCGKLLRANDDDAGKRARCPQCGAILTLPALAPVPAAGQAPAPRPRTVPEPTPPPPENAEGMGDWGGMDDEAVTRQKCPGLAGLSNEYAIDLGQWFGTANRHHGAVLGPMIGYLFLFLGIWMVLMLLSYVVIGLFGVLFLVPQLAAGPTIVCLAQLKGQRWTFGDFFGGFRRYGTWLGLELLLTLLQLACLLPGLILTFVLVAIGKSLDEHGPNTGSAVLAFVILGIWLVSAGVTVYVWFRTAIFARQLVIDRGCGAVEAIKGCWRLTRGHFWGLFGVFLLLMLILAGTAVLTCGIATIFVAPYVLLVLTSGYLHIAGTRPPSSGPASTRD